MFMRCRSPLGSRLNGISPFILVRSMAGDRGGFSKPGGKFTTEYYTGQSSSEFIHLSLSNAFRWCQNYFKAGVPFSEVYFKQRPFRIVVFCLFFFSLIKNCPIQRNPKIQPASPHGQVIYQILLPVMCFLTPVIHNAASVLSLSLCLSSDHQDL